MAEAAKISEAQRSDLPCSLVQVSSSRPLGHSGRPIQAGILNVGRFEFAQERFEFAQERFEFAQERFQLVRQPGITVPPRHDFTQIEDNRSYSSNWLPLAPQIRTLDDCHTKSSSLRICGERGLGGEGKPAL